MLVTVVGGSGCTNSYGDISCKVNLVIQDLPKPLAGAGTTMCELSKVMSSWLNTTGI
jgi:hypothetical protein